MATLLSSLVRSYRSLGPRHLLTTVYPCYLRARVPIELKFSRPFDPHPSHPPSPPVTLLSLPFQSLNLNHPFRPPSPTKASRFEPLKNSNFPSRNLNLHHQRIDSIRSNSLASTSSIDISNHNPQLVDGQHLTQKLTSTPSSASILDQITHDRVASRFSFPTPNLSLA